MTITPFDLEQIHLLGGFLESGDAETLLAYAFENLDYVQNQLAGVVQSVEGYWGFYRADGGEKASLEVMREIGERPARVAARRGCAGSGRGRGLPRREAPPLHYEAASAAASTSSAGTSAGARAGTRRFRFFAA